jgi:hypothetical protein
MILGVLGRPLLLLGGESAQTGRGKGDSGQSTYLMRELLLDFARISRSENVEYWRFTVFAIWSAKL